MGVVNIDSLNREAKNYQKDFRLLPYALLIPTLKELRISLLDVNYKDTIIVKERRGGISAPYVSGSIDYATEISRLRESDLVTKAAYASVKDNILNYREKNVLYDAAKNKVNNQTKKHPLERDIIADQIITVGEDIIDAIYFAEYNTADKSPLGMLNGFNTIIDDAVVATEISLAKGNLVNTGDGAGDVGLGAPVNEDTKAFDNLIKWLRKADPKIHNKPLLLELTPTILLNVQDALENKLKGKPVEFPALLKHIQAKSGLSKLSIVSHYCMGTGDRISLRSAGNYDLGFNTLKDSQFCQVRNPWEDPNEVQFWMQWHIGERIQNFHKRTFMVNEGTAVGNELSGDYQL